MKEVNILMLGGKRCGKTTVLASMCAEINPVLEGTGLRLEAEDRTRADLERARSVIERKMEDFKTPLTRVEVDENPTSALKTYDFRLMEGGARLPFHIHDIPGEWLTDSHAEQVRALVRGCEVIMIAIDTPYLFSKMTGKGYGLYHEEYNKPLEIANFFKNSLSVEQLANRMILFVPIKCERYYHLTHTPQLNVFGRDYMRELVDAVGCGYRELLGYLHSTPELLGGCTLAVTPILSAGGIDFVRFRTDEETGKVISLYQQPEFLRESEQGYSPRFCEQPMIYALVDILLREMASPKPLFGGMNRRTLEAAVDTLRRKLRRGAGDNDSDGFCFLQNPRRI